MIAKQLTFGIPSMKPKRPTANRRRPPKTKEDARDETLIAMSSTRAFLIEKATEIAVEICKRQGHVTSPQVLKRMHEIPELAAMLASCDPRWAGGVFLKSRGWRNTGTYVNEGHKARPVPRWVR